MIIIFMTILKKSFENISLFDIEYKFVPYEGDESIIDLCGHCKLFNFCYSRFHKKFSSIICDKFQMSAVKYFLIK